MAAYAALVSSINIIEQIQRHPNRPSIFLDSKQVECLTQKISFLQDFLEGYPNDSSSKEADELESRIADAAYAAEDVIESRIVDQILDGSTDHVIEISSTELYHDLQKVIEEMDFIVKEVMKIKEKRGVLDQPHMESIQSDVSSRSPSMGQNPLVGLDDILNEVMNKLTGQQSNRQIIPIVGMGGIGKTTLARNIYARPLIVQRFDILAWAAISQEYRVKEILIQLLLCLKKKSSKESLSQMTEEKIGEILYKSLYGRRYLVIMDDMWSIEAWDKVKFFFPDNNQSRIIVTTRLSSIAFQLAGSERIDMSFLDEGNSWNLLCKIVFGESDCPLELEETGKIIARNCKGLPLSIVVIGGLLANSKRAQEYWEYIAKNLSYVVNLEDNERCLKILCTSYDELPVHLKPCFLYMGVFPEDCDIRVSLLVKLWNAEGFLRPIIGKRLEIVAEEYIKDLIDRNLILVHKFGLGAKIKSCSIHDLLRDLCLREAQRTKFLYVKVPHSANIPLGINNQRRVIIHQSTKEEYLPHVHALQPTSALVRSLVCDSPQILSSLNLKLLRVLKADERILHYGDMHSVEAIFQLINSRYIAFGVDWLRISTYLSSIHLLWNLQTLVAYGTWEATAPPEIWKMPQLKHVKFDLLDLPNPPSSQEKEGEDDAVILENLETLSRLRNFKCSQEVVKRIPNIKKLRLHYQGIEGGSGYYCLNNIGHLHKLEYLDCTFDFQKKPSRSDFVESLSFPDSLKKLTLKGVRLHWEDVVTKIGPLPNLEVLKLNAESFEGSEWETVEGQFCNLTLLQIEGCDELEYWRTDSSHFPRLEHIVLRDLDNLKEVPSSIGDIAVLRLIELDSCSDSAVISAKEMLEEQEDLGNVDLRIRVHFWDENQLESLASHNFQVEIW